jgi:endonuclease/exonuclease/phosphatase family metal-dependent hydrolase
LIDIKWRLAHAAAYWLVLVGMCLGQDSAPVPVKDGPGTHVQQHAGAERLRVLSYNIHHGEGIDRKLDLARIARVIRSAEADIVSLQEVDRKVARTGGVDQPAELAQLTEMHVAFGGNIALQGGEYGNAVLSRWPIRRFENHKLPCFDNGEQRGVLELEIDLPGNSSPLLLFATHFDHRPKDTERLASVKALAAIVAKHADRPAVLAGDLNDLPESPVVAELDKQWTRSNRTLRATVPVGNPILQIDYVLFRPGDRWTVIETRVLDEAVASDHRPILAVLEVAPRR